MREKKVVSKSPFNLRIKSKNYNLRSEFNDVIHVFTDCSDVMLSHATAFNTRSTASQQKLTLAD